MLLGVSLLECCLLWNARRDCVVGEGNFGGDALELEPL
jgi:hypothetical protein